MNTHSSAEGRVEQFQQIQQAPDEAQGWHTQCEHPERKSMLGSGNATLKKNRCQWMMLLRLHFKSKCCCCCC